MSWDESWRIDDATLDDVERVANELQLDLLKEIDSKATTIAGDIGARVETNDDATFIEVRVSSASANRYSWTVTTTLASELVRRLGWLAELNQVSGAWCS